MLFAIAAALFALLKWAEIDPFAGVSWWWVALPVGLAIVWWEVLDPMLSISKRREVRKMDERKVQRHLKMQKDLGLIDTKRGKKRSGRSPL
jgi:small Trp-rich protein